MKITTKQIATGGILLAVCIVSQFFKNLSVFITGPIINACLIIAVLTVGLVCGALLALITPVTAFIITGSPVMAAVPAVIPMVMLGNLILVIFVWAFDQKILAKQKEPVRLIAGMAVGSIVKALFMGATIVLWLLPSYLPAAKQAGKVPDMLQKQFSVVQLVTALIGSVYAYIIWLALKKYFKGAKMV